MKWSARALPSGTVAFHGLVEPALAARYMRAADASLVPLDAQAAPRRFVPRKALRLLRCGRAVILAAAGESQRLVTEARAGITVPPADADALHMPFDACRGIRHSVHVPGKRARARDALPVRATA
jgi:glycosyltransferase involved in cell wall biosynthesis